MTRIALVSDIHGNQTALKAVVEDIKKQSIDETWCLGDLLLPGPAGNRIFELLDEINTTIKLRGNWDDVFLKITDNTSTYNLDDPSQIYLGYLAQFLSNKLASKYVSELFNAPIQTEITKFNLNIVLSHNEIDNNGGPNLFPDAATDKFNQLFKNDTVDVALYGHTHHQIMRYSSQDQLVINPGSVGEPFFHHSNFNNDRRAQYAILDLDHTGLANIQFKKIAYDIETEYRLSKESELPYLNLYYQLLTQGISPTQNKMLLDEYNKNYNYTNKLESYLNQKSVE